MTVGETAAVDFVNGRRFLDNELDMFFQFDTSSLDIGILPIWRKRVRPKDFKKTFFDWQREVDWNAVFLENHDQRRSIGRFGDPKKRWKESAKMLGTILFTLRGTPFVYEGEEIGMLDYPLFAKDQYQDPVNFYIYDTLRKHHFPAKRALRLVQNCNRDNARTPMQWNGRTSAGFSVNERTWLPVNPNFRQINVEAEEKDPDSILAYYKKLFALRKEDPILSYGDFEPVKTKGSIMAYYRAYDGHMEFILLNLTRHKRRLPRAIRQMKGQVLLANYVGAGFVYKKTLRPYEALIVRVS